jgi:hypothetical protein
MNCGATPAALRILTLPPRAALLRRRAERQLGPAASLLEQISLQNLTSDALEFHLFQYADFDMVGTAR